MNPGIWGRSPPRGRKVIRNQGRKYFRSPSPNRPYTSGMTKQNARCANTNMTQIPVTEMAAPTRGRRADSVTSNARHARAPQHFVPWGIKGGPPPPFFSRQNEQFRSHLQRRRTPPPISGGSNGNFEASAKRCQSLRNLPERTTAVSDGRRTASRRCP